MHETTFICSLVYNQCLAQRKESWEKERYSISCYDQIKQLSALKEKDERFQSVHSQILQDAIRRVDKAFKNFSVVLKLAIHPVTHASNPHGGMILLPIRKVDSALLIIKNSDFPRLAM